MSSYPVEMVTTKLGKVRVMANGRRTLYVSTDSTERDENGHQVENWLTVRGINYRGSVHLEDYGNGYELHKNSAGWTGDASYLSRKGHYGKNDGVSDSAKKVLIDAMVAAALEWVKANPNTPIFAGIHEEEQNAERLMGDVAKLEREIEDLKAKASQCRERRLAYIDSLHPTEDIDY